MISKLSKRIAQYLADKNKIDGDEIDLYHYGLFVMISEFFLMFCSLVIGIIFKIPLQGVIFYLVFYNTQVCRWLSCKNRISLPGSDSLFILYRHCVHQTCRKCKFCASCRNTDMLSCDYGNTLSCRYAAKGTDARGKTPI